MIRLLIVFLLTVVVLLLGLANLHVVEINTVFAGVVRSSIAFFLLGSFALGFVIALLLGIQRSLKLRGRNHARLTRHVEQERPRLPPPPQIFVRDSRHVEP